MPGKQLDSDCACHSSIALAGRKGSPLLHIIVAYCGKDQEQHRRDLIEYAEALGDVPVVIGADWNALPEETQAVQQAMLTGRWMEVAQTLADQGNVTAKAVVETGTSNKEGSKGRRIDYFIVNKCAFPFLEEIKMMGKNPLTNHYAIVGYFLHGYI